MTRRAHLSRLPDDLVAGILALLPPRHIARARLVCRRWRDLTTDHHFLRASFSRHAGHSVAGFFFNYRFVNTTDYLPLDRNAESEAAAGGDRLTTDLSFIPGTLSANPGRSSLYVYSSCNGLLLLICRSSNGQAICYVCSPLTKKLIPIGEPKGASSRLYLALAFDPSKSRHWKVVALVENYSVHVYSSETRSWQMAVHSDHCASLFRGLSPARGVFWNGSVVWIVAHSLVCFVIEGEHVTKMPMSPRKKDWICAYIGVSGGHLQMIGYTKEKLTGCFDILEMQEGQSEWSVLYRVDLNRVKELYPNIDRPTWDTQNHQHKVIDYLALSPIYVIRGTKTGKHGVLIFSIPGKIMSYNMEDQEVSMIQEVMSAGIEQLAHPFELFWYSFYAYNPSLFPM
uniref:F-box domain-containing protein n=1 Tax=Arundo donax TaxID=35708 RepID=A0A0A9FRU7_ARUDO